MQRIVIGGEDCVAPLVLVVSDALGETAELVARAAASQFDQPVEVRRLAHIDSTAAVDEVLRHVQDRPEVVIIHTIVLPEVRRHLEQEAQRRGIVHVDVMGPVLTALTRFLPAPQRLEPGRMHRVNAEYFHRIEAVEFAVKYDDGLDPRGTLRADVVLTGVSRTSKTPLAMYLAHRGVKVANVPLVPEADLPDELFQVSPRRIIGLTVNPELLLQIRTERLRSLGLGPGARYADLGRILEEMEYADGVFRRLRCQVLDVSNQAVEELASRVVQIVGLGGG